MGSFFKWLQTQCRDVWLGCTTIDGHFSNTRFFGSIAYATVTWVIVHQELAGRLSTEIVLVFLGTVAGHNVLLRGLDVKKDIAKTEGATDVAVAKEVTK